MDSDSSEAQEVIRAEGISLRRGPVTLLADISWQVRRGEHWAVLGLNGAGKTLLMQTLLGYVWPTTGRVTVLGHALGQVNLRTLRRSLGWVAKALEELTPPLATVLEVILSGAEASLGLYVEPQAHQVRAAEELAEEFGLAPIVRRPFGLLSSGEKQRTLLARAASIGPEILFLDEPMSNLDMGGREQFMALLEKMAGRPKAPTIIMTTHNTLEISAFMTHALFMKNGRTAARGSLKETMRPEILQKAFDLPLKVERTASGRYLAYL